MDKKQAKEFAVKTARFIDDKKAEDVKVYDLCGLSSLCDYIVIGTATSTPHLEALDQDAGTELKQDGIYKNNRDGGQTTTWRVSDYGNFMMHIMTKAAREFYALDKIFSFGKEVKWQKAAKKAEKETEETIKKTIKKTASKVKKTVKEAEAKAAKTVKELEAKAIKTVKKVTKALKAAEKPVKKTAAKTVKTVKKAVKTAKKEAPKTVKKAVKTVKKAAQNAKKTVKKTAKKSSK